MGLAGIALDADGRLYIAEMTGRIVRVDPKSGKQDTYASFPTDTRTSYTNMPGFVVFDRDGYLYTGDTAGEPIIWRIPPGGGQAEPWFVDPRLASVYTQGVGGIKIDPTGRYLFFQLFQPTGSAVIYRLPLHDPQASKLEEFHRFDAGSIFPISISFGKSGKLYAVNIADGIHVLRPDGTEERHFPDDAMMPPYSCPFDAAFDGRGSLLINNLGCVGALPSQDPDTWTVVDAWVDDTAHPLSRPSIPG
jgi:sugar lactone lactonase YvrE